MFTDHCHGGFESWKFLLGIQIICPVLSKLTCVAFLFSNHLLMRRFNSKKLLQCIFWCFFEADANFKFNILSLETSRMPTRSLMCDNTQWPSSSSVLHTPGPITLKGRFGNRLFVQIKTWLHVYCRLESFFLRCNLLFSGWKRKILTSIIIALNYFSVL